MVWCERKILFQFIIHDRIRASEHVVCSEHLNLLSVSMRNMHISFLLQIDTMENAESMEMSYELLKELTHNFSYQLGCGTYGVVYKV